MCPYELALKLHELGVNSESEFYFVKEMKGGGSQTESVTQNTMRYSYKKEGDLIPAYMSHELGEILPSVINISKSKIWDDWLQLANISRIRISNTTKLLMFDTMLTIHKQKCIVDLEVQRWSRGRCCLLIYWIKKY